MKLFPMIVMVSILFHLRTSQAAGDLRFGYISTYVANLLKKPEPLTTRENDLVIPLLPQHCPILRGIAMNLDTQLLFGDPIIILNEPNAQENAVFIKVAAPWQIKYNNKKEISFFTGWVYRDCIIECSNDTSFNKSIDQAIKTKKLQAFSKKMTPQEVIQTAKQFIGTQYVWGGSSPYNPKEQVLITGVDSSGLIHLCFNKSGILIPRDAHDQYNYSRHLSTIQELSPGDLVFIGSSNKKQFMAHVILFCETKPDGSMIFIEAYGSPHATKETPWSDIYEQSRVCRRTGTELFGNDYKKLSSGDCLEEGLYPGNTVYFGSLLDQPALNWQDMIAQCIRTISNKERSS